MKASRLRAEVLCLVLEDLQILPRCEHLRNRIAHDALHVVDLPLHTDCSVDRGRVGERGTHVCHELTRYLRESALRRLVQLLAE